MVTIESKNMQVIEIQNNGRDLHLLDKFYEQLFVPQFPMENERESLENIKKYLSKKESGWYEKNNYHILLLLIDDKIVGGSISDYFAKSNAGVIEFIVVDPSLRNAGLGSLLIQHTEEILRADAENHLGTGIDWFVAEMDDPFNLKSIGFDAFTRVKAWSRWGYCRIRAPYIQPALSDKQKPAYHLCLIAKVTNRIWLKQGIPSEKIKTFLCDYFRWAMRINDPENQPEFVKVSRFLKKYERIPLLPLDQYTGDAALKKISIVEVLDSHHEDFFAALSIFKNSFENGAISFGREILSSALSSRRNGESGHLYHLWLIRNRDGMKTCGMSSFFTLTGLGYCGYIAFETGYRGQGLLRQLIPLIEKQMIQDRKGAAGWFIECHDDTGPIFSHYGFKEVGIKYKQPPLPVCQPQEEPYRLLYKQFGDPLDTPKLSLEFLEHALREIFKVVYGSEDESICKANLDSANLDKDGNVRMMEFK